MDQTALFKLSYGLYVVGVKNGDSFGGCIVDAMMQVTSDMPPLLMLGSMRNNLTNQLIRKTGELTISVLRADADPFLIANFGFQSARKVEKWENVEYAVKDGLPVLLDAASYLRCRVLEAKDLSTHTVYTCEVTDAWNGDGEPLLYSDYQKHMKDATRKAFQNFLNAKKVEHTVPEQEQKPQWVCSVCGYVYEGENPPEKCPQCGVPASKFTEQKGELSWAAEHVVGVGKSFGESVPAEVQKEIIDGLNLSLDLSPEFEKIAENFAAAAGEDYAASRGEYLNGIVMANYLGYTYIDSAEVSASTRTETSLQTRLTKCSPSV